MFRLVQAAAPHTPGISSDEHRVHAEVGGLTTSGGAHQIACGVYHPHADEGLVVAAAAICAIRDLHVLGSLWKVLLTPHQDVGATIGAGAGEYTHLELLLLWIMKPGADRLQLIATSIIDRLAPCLGSGLQQQRVIGRMMTVRHGEAHAHAGQDSCAASEPS